MTKTTIQADAPIQECINDVLSVPREKFLNIASKLDSLAFDDDPYEYHDNEGVESISDIADNLLNPTYRKAIIKALQDKLEYYAEDEFDDANIKVFSNALRVYDAIWYNKNRGDTVKTYTLIGGVNGAGKSSLTGSLRSERSDLGIVVDPDKLTVQCGGDEYEGGKLAVKHIEQALEDGVNFTQETTLSGGYPKRLCKRAKEAGYYIRLYYVGLDTAEESIRRIQNRVERGGHDIPTKDVKARFSHRFEDVLKILPYCDEAKFFDNDNGFVLVAEYRNGQILPVGTYRPMWLSQLMEQFD